MKDKKLFSEKLSRECPEHRAIVGSGHECTYRDLHRGINGLSRRLHEMGVEKGSRLMVCYPSRGQ